MRAPVAWQPLVACVATAPRRSVAALVVTTAAIAAVWGIATTLERSLARPDWWTGGCVAGSLVVLTALGVRRRLPLLRVGSMSTWTRVHRHVGVFAIAGYVMHAPAVIGSGPLEASLSIAFVVVAASGVYGSYASRTLPRRLTAIPGEHRFDQIDWHRQQIATMAADQVRELAPDDVAELLRRHFQTQLAGHFESPPPWWALVLASPPASPAIAVGIE